MNVICFDTYFCFHMHVLFLPIWDDTPAFYASISRRLLSKTIYTCFLCKYFYCHWMITHMLFMQVFHIHLLFVQVFLFLSVGDNIHLLLMQVFFIVIQRLHTCFLCTYLVYTCFLCKYFLLSVGNDIHLLFVQVFFLFFIFIIIQWLHTCFLCMYFVYTCFLCKYFLSSMYDIYFSYIYFLSEFS